MWSCNEAVPITVGWHKGLGEKVCYQGSGRHSLIYLGRHSGNTSGSSGWSDGQTCISTCRKIIVLNIKKKKRRGIYIILEEYSV